MKASKVTDAQKAFVIKQGDITRGVWSGDTDRVRESLEEVVLRMGC